MRILYYHKAKGLLWFRLFGVGLIFKKLSLRSMLFSERYGLQSYVVCRRWLIRAFEASQALA